MFFYADCLDVLLKQMELADADWRLGSEKCNDKEREQVSSMEQVAFELPSFHEILGSLGRFCCESKVRTPFQTAISSHFLT